ncbi:MAG: polysaccharide biosynthesis C-terminal domain-containing protein, partial [Flavobacteriales bacterium]
FSTSKKYKVDLFFTMFLILGVYFTNLWLIPIFGMIGAAISTSVAYLFYNVFRGLYIYKEYNLSPYTQIQLRLFLLAIVTFGGIYLFNEYLLVQLDLTTISSIVLKEVLLALVFFIPIYIWNLEPETVSYIHKTWNKWRRN